MAHPRVRYIAQTLTFCEWCRSTRGDIVLEDTEHFVCECAQFDDLRANMRAALKQRCRELFHSAETRRFEALVDAFPSLIQDEQLRWLLCGGRVWAVHVPLHIRPFEDFVTATFCESFLWPAMERYLRERLQSREIFSPQEIRDAVREWRGF